MNTPLFSAVEAYLRKDAARFHMPGHKGRMPVFADASRYDITEVGGCDSLYEATAAIAETEARYASLYGSEASLLSAGGSTLCIQTMLALAVNPGGNLICARGCHVSAVNSMALLDLNPVWVFPDIDAETGLANAVTADEIRKALLENPDVSAVYVTSPDYYGVMCDVASISAACREFSVPLLIDNAHGAHLKFLSPSRHPINLGADMVCDSLHKTLPVLTGGAMLHIRDSRFVPDAKRFMSIFGSTSPSYLIMLSADSALQTLCGDFPQKLEVAAVRVSGLEKLAVSRGFAIPNNGTNGGRDPVRLSLGFYAMGYGREEFAGLIRQSGIEPEMTDENFCVLMASPFNSPEDFDRLAGFIEIIPAKKPRVLPRLPRICPARTMSVRESALSKAVNIPVADAAGKVAASMVCPCPPGVPLLIPGEAIDKNLVKHLQRYGISHLNVLK